MELLLSQLHVIGAAKTEINEEPGGNINDGAGSNGVKVQEAAAGLLKEQNRGPDADPVDRLQGNRSSNMNLFILPAVYESYRTKVSG